MYEMVKQNMPACMEWFEEQGWDADDFSVREWTLATNACWYLGGMKLADGGGDHGKLTNCKGIRINT